MITGASWYLWTVIVHQSGESDYSVEFETEKMAEFVAEAINAKAKSEGYRCTFLPLNGTKKFPD